MADKGISMKQDFKRISSEGHNPFNMVTHINGKPIKKKEVAKKMKLDPNDSDALREFSRYDKENKRPLFKMPEGTYKKVGDRYIRQTKES